MRRPLSAPRIIRRGAWPRLVAPLALLGLLVALAVPGVMRAETGAGQPGDDAPAGAAPAGGDPAAGGEGGGAGGPQGPPPVQTAPPLQRTVVDWQDHTGRFQAHERVELRARVSGYLEQIRFEEGSRVRQGDLLFVIDRRPFEAALALAEAQVRQAEAAVAQAVADRVRATSALRLAQAEVRRAQQLAQSNAIAAEVLDQRRAAADQARAGLEAAEAAIAAAEARVVAAEAEVQVRRLDLDFTEIRAPISGRIGEAGVDVGNLVQAGGERPLATILAADPIDFVIDMSEQDYLALAQSGGGRLTQGEPLLIAQAGDDGWPHVGVLDFVDNELGVGSGTIRLRALVDNPQGILTPGAFGRLRLAASQPYPALLVPERAIQADQGGRVVMTVNLEGTVVPKPVKTAGLVGDWRIIRSGLDDQDLVVVDGLLMARPGGQVTAVPAQVQPPPEEALRPPAPPPEVDQVARAGVGLTDAAEDQATTLPALADGGAAERLDPDADPRSGPPTPPQRPR